MLNRTASLLPIDHALLAMEVEETLEARLTGLMMEDPSLQRHSEQGDLEPCTSSC